MINHKLATVGQKTITTQKGERLFMEKDVNTYAPIYTFYLYLI